ncbi:MAG: cytoplasmic protein [Candidatus Eremiobacteraeota bacterium]|nr:cytoplasmic protein [Candidatus Eremiobacteraeota bacterium]
MGDRDNAVPRTGDFEEERRRIVDDYARGSYYRTSADRACEEESRGGGIALFAFNGESMCFMHVLLNALDMHQKGLTVAVVIEGAACGLVPQLLDESSPLGGHFLKAEAAGIIAGLCRACAAKAGTLKEAEARGISLLSDMAGHPSMEAFRERGFAIITF